MRQAFAHHAVITATGRACDSVRVEPLTMTTDDTPSRPNFLMIMVDQLRYPQRGDGHHGFADPIKDILVGS